MYYIAGYRAFGGLSDAKDFGLKSNFPSPMFLTTGSAQTSVYMCGGLFTSGDDQYMPQPTLNITCGFISGISGTFRGQCGAQFVGKELKSF